METRYYHAQTILKEALCNNCGKILKYVKSDLSRKDFGYVHPKCCLTKNMAKFAHFGQF